MGKGTYKVILRVASVILIILSVVSLIEMLINGSLVARFRAVIDAIIALSGIESAVISLLLLVLSALFGLIAGIVG